MTKDYAKPSTTRTASSAGKKKPQRRKNPASGGGRRKQSPPPSSPPKRGKLFFILALLIAGFGFGIYSLQKIPATMAPEPSNNAANKRTTAPPPAAKVVPEQRFKFYDLLPESEVIPPKVDSYKFKKKSSSNDYYYMVQTGSFRSNADAERQKATIAFQGLKATVKPVQSAQGKTWYRVMTGPFYSRSEMNSVLDKLVSIQIEPLVKKVKK